MHVPRKNFKGPCHVKEAKLSCRSFEAGFSRCCDHALCAQNQQQEIVNHVASPSRHSHVKLMHCARFQSSLWLGDVMVLGPASRWWGAVWRAYLAEPGFTHWSDQILMLLRYKVKLGRKKKFGTSLLRTKQPDQFPLRFPLKGVKFPFLVTQHWKFIPLCYLLVIFLLRWRHRRKLSRSIIARSVRAATSNHV